MPLTVGTIALALVLAACGSGTGAPSVTPGGGPILGAGDAASAVAARNPLFGGIDQRDPNLIGQSAWWEATPTDAAKPPVPWTVTFTIGWGDCEAGCIDAHTWTYAVAADGQVAFVGDDGSPLPDDVVAQRIAADTRTGVGGRVMAGPTCPVEQPGDPACAGRPVVGAQLEISNAAGTVARVTTDASGWYRIDLDPGDYVLTASAVEGLMGTPGPLPFTVRDGTLTPLDVPYDTGIR